VELPGHENDESVFNCDRKLMLEGDVWSVTKI
jgi:ATP phosphoribosyltransferase regulatory subunit